MVTAAAVYHIFHFFNLTVQVIKSTVFILSWLASIAKHMSHISFVQIRNVCVLLAPWFASNTAIATYLFTSEAYDKVCRFSPPPVGS